ncbi:12334_t:CDS:2 [Funneliformis caledonium]|uniref:12334_t:CDS:1 n=1 Tax=Funneliformis caledonium TaxID=1117310 RepID=A0A9N9FJK0_9GLOM|nr:12334_t:CDS:2 [Funneliformis caledonium]
MDKTSRFINNFQLWFRGTSWKYSPVTSNNSISKSEFTRAFTKSPKKLCISIILINLFIISIALIVLKTSFRFMERMIDGDGTCILPPWKPITQDQYPIEVIPGRTIAKIIHDPSNGEQEIDVECDSAYQYHFPSMSSGKKFESWDQKKNGLLKFAEDGERHKRLATITLMDTHNADLNLIGLDKSMVNLLTKLLIGKGNQPPLLDENR